MTASLPMYWRSETAHAWQRFWTLVQQAHDGPLPALTLPEDLPEDWYDHWRDPDMVLSQTCGLPWRSVLQDSVTYVASPDFGLQGCPPGYYYSTALRRRDGPNGLRIAVNAFDSQSGWAAAQPHLVDHPTDEVIVTGAHAASARAVAEGVADIAFVDAVTWRLLDRFEPWAQALTVTATTRPTPALPWVTAATRDPASLREALETAARQIDEETRALMGGLQGVTHVDRSAYFAELIPPQPSVFHAYAPETDGQSGENTA